MDSLKLNTAVGAACVAGLVFLFGKWAVETATHRGELAAHSDDHGEGEIVQAYAVEVEGGGSDAGSEDAGPSFAVFLAAADPVNGEKGFGKCKACHSIEPGKNGTGPSLDGVYNAPAAQVAGFDYSSAMIEYAQPWNGENLFTFLGDVKGTVPGTKMSFPGIKDEQDRADVIAYLAGDAWDASVYAAAAESAEAETAQAAEGEAAEGEAMETAALPVGDAAAGEKVFGKCKACHSVEPGKNGTGPSLAGVVGSPAAQVEGFNYSKAMIEYGQDWTEENLAAFLTDVKGTVPGTKMSFPGLKKDQEVADVIAYLAAN